MPPLEWSETYRTGLPRVDIQHQEIFRLINQILDPQNKKLTKEGISRVLRFLINYVGEHFTDEERFMRASRYPGLDDHRAKHEALTLRANELYLKGLDPQVEMGEGLAHFLGTWLTTHIIETDVPFVHWVKNRWHTLPKTE
jgi:hemerythrin